MGHCNFFALLFWYGQHSNYSKKHKHILITNRSTTNYRVCVCLMCLWFESHSAHIYQTEAIGRALSVQNRTWNAHAAATTRHPYMCTFVYCMIISFRMCTTMIVYKNNFTYTSNSCTIWYMRTFCAGCPHTISHMDDRLHEYVCTTMLRVCVCIYYIRIHSLYGVRWVYNSMRAKVNPSIKISGICAHGSLTLTSHRHTQWYNNCVWSIHLHAFVDYHLAACMKVDLRVCKSDWVQEYGKSRHCGCASYWELREWFWIQLEELNKNEPHMILITFQSDWFCIIASV